MPSLAGTPGRRLWMKMSASPEGGAQTASGLSPVQARRARRRGGRRCRSGLRHRPLAQPVEQFRGGRFFLQAGQFTHGQKHFQRLGIAVTAGADPGQLAFHLQLETKIGAE